jgi:hypothetical protein
VIRSERSQKPAIEVGDADHRRRASSSQSSTCFELIVRFGISGFSVPAVTFEPSVSLALANSFASCSFRNVSVIRNLPADRSLGSNETYHVSLDLSERGRRFISPSPYRRSEDLTALLA